MSRIKFFGAIFMMFLSPLSFGKLAALPDLIVTKTSDSAISIRTAVSERHCFLDQKIIDVKLSSDRQAVIVSGESYIPVAELIQCRQDRLIHAKRAAPHVGFLSDINLQKGIYASMIPVATNPLSFLAVIGKIGNDRNIINLPGFYRKGVSKSQLLSEASSGMLPTISVDARYVSLDIHSCGSDGSVTVVDVRSNMQVEIDRSLCNQVFIFQ